MKLATEVINEMITKGVIPESYRTEAELSLDRALRRNIDGRMKDIARLVGDASAIESAWKAFLEDK